LDRALAKLAFAALFRSAAFLATMAAADGVTDEISLMDALRFRENIGRLWLTNG
jgi:hypothetical protein